MGKLELEQGRAQGVPVGSKGFLKVDVLMCPTTSTSMAAVDAVPVVADTGMTML